MRVYKLVDQNMCTRDGECQWVLGEKKSISDRPELCRVGFHAYSDPLLAIACNPFHANILDPRLFEAEVGGEHAEDALKSCWQEMTLLAELPVPKITVAQLVRWAIYCAQTVYHFQPFDAWAERWLSGEDRTREAAEEARASAWRRAARRAAEAAAAAAAVLDMVAEGADDEMVAEAEEDAAWAAAEVAESAAGAAAEAVGAARGQGPDVLALLRQAIAEEK